MVKETLQNFMGTYYFLSGHRAVCPGSFSDPSYQSYHQVRSCSEELAFDIQKLNAKGRLEKEEIAWCLNTREKIKIQCSKIEHCRL